jgi:hypothetical protein
MAVYPEEYDLIVVGAGHAGCEGALAAVRMGLKVLLLNLNLDTMAAMACNPAVGGLAKGHLVKEIDALGGSWGAWPISPASSSASSTSPRGRRSGAPGSSATSRPTGWP